MTTEQYRFIVPMTIDAWRNGKLWSDMMKDRSTWCKNNLSNEWGHDKSIGLFWFSTQEDYMLFVLTWS